MYIARFDITVLFFQNTFIDALNEKCYKKFIKLFSAII